VILRCLARRPADRYSNVEELAAALRRNIAQPERWRGTLTGKFSRQVLAEAASAARAASPPSAAPSPRPGVLAALVLFAGALSARASSAGALSAGVLAAWLRAHWGFGAWLAIALAAAALAGGLAARLEQLVEGAPVVAPVSASQVAP